MTVPCEGQDLVAATAIFGDRLPLAQRYVEHLATTGIERGLIGPREVPRLWARHVLNCAAVQEYIAEGASVADVGSGAGLPGLCLAIARPDLAITLIEPLERRVIWLHEVVEDLGLENVKILRSRAEQAIGQVDADVVTARAVSALVGLVDITLPILRGFPLFLCRSFARMGNKLLNGTHRKPFIHDLLSNGLYLCLIG